MYKPLANKILADALVNAKLISADDAVVYIAQAKAEHRNLHSYLIRHDIVTEEEILRTLATQLNLTVVDLKNLEVPADVIAKVPVKFASFYKFVPVAIHGQELVIAVAAPLDIKVSDDIRVHLGLIPKEVLATKTDIEDALRKYYGLASDTIDKILTQQPQRRKIDMASEVWVEDIEKKSDDPSVAKLVNQIILEAYQQRATDIHLEPYRHKIRLRYRIDGVLIDANLPLEARQFMPAILSRIKIMCNLSITEKRLPQDGAAIVRTKDQDLDLRVSTMPTLRGESMVIRILPTKSMRNSLESLGLDEKRANQIRRLIQKPHGIIFVTGPTGSGKTTTLYAALHELNKDEHKIITIEDPIEFEMEGVTQIQVNPKLQFSFADGLRSILRHDPDIIMVGEVRDLETAEIAIRTALTGHLVLSTLHTNDAASGITRLIDMGVEPYLVASSVEAFIAQRLVRIICPKCKTEDRDVSDTIKDEIVKSLGLNFTPIIYKGQGCDYCHQTGYYGRTAIYEILEMTEEIRYQITQKPQAEFIKRIATRQGMMSLRQHGWQVVVQGITAPAEVLHLTANDQLVQQNQLSMFS